MSTIVRWQPWTETKSLFDEFDRLITRPVLRTAENSNLGLALDVVEGEDKYVVKATIPGINPDDLEMTLEENVLMIKGEVAAEEIDENERYHVRERRYGSFSRRVRFPMTVDADNVEAVYENGILTLSIPKAETVMPKRITLKS
ncbi:MAG TPA: Hsp20/alpha crystallin family protein [Anaerolineae bacterium]|nr:Hsp20/alpha crystallin family protein [Anaerolineae bacterium]